MVYYLSPKDISIRSYDQKSVNCHTCSSFWALVIANAQLSRTLNSRRISACGAVTTVLICYKSQVKSSQGSFLVGSEEWFQILFLEVTTSKSGAVNHHLNQPQFREKPAILENFK